MANKSVEVGKHGNVAGEQVVKDKQSSLVDIGTPNVKNTGLNSYSPLPMHGSTPAGNSPGKSSYDNVIGEPSRNDMNFYTLFTPRGNGIDVVVLVESIRSISKRFVNTSYGFFLGKRMAYPIVANYVRNTWGKYGLVKSMLNSSTGLFSFKFSSMDGLNAMFEIGPWFIRNHPLILKKWNPNVNLFKEDVGKILVECPKNLGLGVAMNLKKPSQAPKSVPFCPKVGFKPAKEYRPVRKKPTANTSGNKKKAMEPTKEKRLVLATQGLLEQWRDSYENGDYDEDPYDDDMYEGQDLPDKIQEICDNLDIRVRGRRMT
nr:hypothetical protein [Tanacetum cinerariifolium]